MRKKNLQNQTQTVQEYFKKGISSLFIFLIVIMPISSSLAFASVIPSSLGIPTYKGDDGVSKSRKATNDILHISIPVKINGTDETLLPTKLAYNNKKEKLTFTTCTLVKGIDYICTLDDSADYPAGSLSGFEIKLTDSKTCSTGQSICTRKISPLYVDGAEPTVTLSLSPVPLASTSLFAMVTVKDTLCPDCSSDDGCSGIASYEIYANDGISLHTETVDTSNTCSLNTQKIQIDTAQLQDGQNTICVYAIDKLGQGSKDHSVCQNVTINRNAPALTVQVFDDKNTELLGDSGFLSSKGIKVYFNISATSELATIKTISLVIVKNVTQISPQTISCSTQNCTFKTNLIQIGKNDIPLSYTVTATDSTDLNAPATGGFTFTVDDSPPIIGDITSELRFNQKNYVTKEGTILTVSYTEEGIGLDTMTLSLGTNHFTVNQTACPSNQCIFNVSLPKKFTNTDTEITAQITAVDKLGNTAAPKSFTLSVDTNQNPKIIPNVLIEDISSAGVHNPFFTTGDTAIVTISLTDDVGMRDDSGNFFVYANMSALTGIGTLVKSQSCMSDFESNEEIVTQVESADIPANTESNPTNSPTLQTTIIPRILQTANCTFPIQDPLISTISQTNIAIPFYVTDFTGKNLDFSKSSVVNIFDVRWSDEKGEHTLQNEHVRVLPKGNLKKQDLWDVSLATISSQFVDRQLLGGGISFPVTAVLTVLPSKNNTEPSHTHISKFSLDTCKDVNGTTDYSSFFDATKTNLIQTGYVGSLEDSQKYLQLYMLPGIIDETHTNLTIQCSFKTVGIYKGKITDPEIDSIILSIPLANDPLGEPAQNVRTEIKDAQTDVLKGFNTFLKYAEYLMAAFTKACSLLNTINTIHQTLALTHDVFAGICDTVFGSFMCGPATAVGKTGEAVGQVSEKLWGDQIKSAIPGAKIICAMMSCRYGGFEAIDVGFDINNIPPDWKYNEGITKAENYVEDLGASFDPKQSAIASVLKLCLPGIIYNMRKYMNLQCTYINCLKQTSSFPASVCSEQRGFQTCKYIVGEFWSMVPFTKVLGAVSTIFQQFYSIGTGLGSSDSSKTAKSVTSLFFVGSGIGCSIACVNPSSAGGCGYCNVLRLGKMWGQVICDLGIPAWFNSDKCSNGLFSSGYWKDGWSDTSTCDSALEKLPEVKKPEATGAAVLGGGTPAVTTPPVATTSPATTTPPVASSTPAAPQ